MTTITGMALDYDKMLADKWSLYFTAGVYQNNSTIKTVSPAIIRLNIEDYADQNLDMFDVFFKPLYSQYNIIKRVAGTEVPNECVENGTHLGGFLVDECTLKFTYPITDTVDYIRPFEDDAFDDGFIDIDEIVEVDADNYTSFSLDFNLDYQTGVPIPKWGDPVAGGFATEAFDTSFDNTTNTP